MKPIVLSTGSHSEMVISGQGRELILTEKHRGMHPRIHRAASVEFFNYENKQYLFRFHLVMGSKWEYVTDELSRSDEISNIIHVTQTPMTATFVRQDMLRYSPCEKPSANTKAKPICATCYGTGYHKGFGAPCEKGCKPCP